MPSLDSKVCAIVKTFLRDGCLLRCVESLQTFHPDVKIIVVDDGHKNSVKSALFTELKDDGHLGFHLPFDAGYSAKFNVGLIYCDRPYVLNVNDDFVFSAEDGLTTMVQILEDPAAANIGVVSGEIDRIPYQGYVHRGPDYFEEIALSRVAHPTREVIAGHTVLRVDITSVYSLSRRAMLRHVKKDQEYKIGGEHLDFFLDVKKAGYDVAFCPEVNIWTRCDDGDRHPDYHQMRCRAHGTWEDFGRKHGVRKYIGFNGGVVWEAPEVPK